MCDIWFTSSIDFFSTGVSAAILIDEFKSTKMKLGPKNVPELFDVPVYNLFCSFKNLIKTKKCDGMVV